MNIPLNLETVFIDLDGTLVNSLPNLYRIYLEFLKNYGIEGSQKEFDEVNGPSIPEVLTTLKKRHHLPDSTHLLTTDYQSRLQQLYKDKHLVMDGAVDALKELKKRHLKLILVTSASQELASLSLHALDLVQYFDMLITGDMVKKGKPDPEIYLLALKKGEVKAENTLVIEDSIHGVNSAVKANIFTIMLNPSVHSPVKHEKWMELTNWNALASFLLGMK